MKLQTNWSTVRKQNIQKHDMQYCVPFTKRTAQEDNNEHLKQMKQHKTTPTKAALATVLQSNTANYAPQFYPTVSGSGSGSGCNTQS